MLSQNSCHMRSEIKTSGIDQFLTPFRFHFESIEGSHISQGTFHKGIFSAMKVLRECLLDSEEVA